MGLAMSFLESIRSLFYGGTLNSGPLKEGRLLDVPSASNYRDLGGYETPHGPTAYRRFVRAGSTERLSESDMVRLEDYGVRCVLDLRSSAEAPRQTCRFARRNAISWENVPLFDYDLSDPALMAHGIPAGNYLIDGYVTMTSNRVAIRRIFEFFAAAPTDGGVLFHCAAGMDRTGITAMLLLGLADVSREQIVADYLYSFAPQDEVDAVVFEGERPWEHEFGWNPLPARKEAVEFVLDGIEHGYGTTRAYLETCGIDGVCLDRVRGMLLGL